MTKNYKKIIDYGASIIGGCCGTTFEHIKRFRKFLNEND